MKVLSIHESLKKLETALDTQESVFFSRFGDNDITIAAKKEKDNKSFYGNNWTKWSPELSKELSRGLKVDEQNFFVAASIGWTHEPGMADGVFAPFKDSEELKAKLKTVIGDVQREFLHPVLFHYIGVFEGQKLKNFIEKYIKPKKKIFIGCQPQKPMELMFGSIDHMIETQDKNAYETIDKWYSEITKILDSEDPPKVVILAAGQASRAASHRLWKAGYKVHCIDFGSIVDAMTTDVLKDTATRSWIESHGYKIYDLFTSDPKIEVIVPYRTGGNLGACYNDYMSRADDWVLFLDHDILILRPEWHAMCLNAIKEKGHRAGWISGVTNRIYCPDQRRRPPGDIDDIRALIQFSNGLYSMANDKLFTPESGVPFSGFFILTHKKAWEAVGGFSNGFLGIDNDYYNRLMAAGYESWVMPGLFCYHIYDRKQLFKNNAAGIVSYEKEQKKETLSVCMIVKNEEKMLNRCLDSVKDIADEIIIVDTGSTDSTIEIARSYGAYIHNHPWQGNFSKHRNQSIKYATGDWLLFIDADEELLGDTEGLKNWLSAVPNEINAINVAMHDMREGKSVLRFNPTKIFRKESVQYEGTVHNQAVYEGESIHYDAIHYHHYGYNLDKDAMEAKAKRRIGLLLKRIEDNSDDHEALFYLCQAHGFEGDWKTMAKYGEAYYALKDKIEKKNLPFDQSIYFSMIRAYQTQLGRPSEARRWINIATSSMNEAVGIDVAFAMCEHGVMTQNAEMMIQGARTYIQEYMQFEQKAATMGAQFVHTYMPEALSYCLFHMGSTQLANAMGTLNQLANPLGKLGGQETGRMMAQVREVLNKVGLDFMAAPAVQPNGKKGGGKKKKKKSKNF